jgi:hypothetical protein
MNVRNVERPLVGAQVLYIIKEFILVRNLTSVRNVGKPLELIQSFLHIREFIQV